MKSSITLTLTLCLAGSSLRFSPASAQITSDGTINTQVNQNGNVAEITGGETRGSNLFHSFQDFSVPTGNEAFFDNANEISNIFSRVTGGNISNIDGLIRANGSSSLFLINPAGIIFGENASLNIGGSFYGSSANSILFPDGVEFSATDTQSEPILTINAPIGLGFRDSPGDIVNRSVTVDDTNEVLIGLRVPTDKTLALLGGNVLIEGGILTTEGGRIELGSVAENSTVSLTSIEEGFDLGYEDVTNFRDISLSSFALVTTSGDNTADIEVQGRNLNFTESRIGINPQFEGQAGDIKIDASESLTLDAEADGFVFITVSGDATAETSSINIDTPQLTINGAAQIFAANNFGDARGIDININASEIKLENPLLTEGFPAIGSQVSQEGTGDGGNITIATEKLILNDGAQITTSTFGSGNGGDLIVNASESIELNGSIPNGIQASALSAGVGIPSLPIPSVGNGGDLTIDTPRLVVSDGAQIETAAQKNGNGGNLTLNISESILLTGTSPLAEFRGGGRSGIFVSAESSYEETDFNETGELIFTGEIIPTTGNGGNLNLNTGSLTIERGAVISAGTFSLGNAGNANINVERLTLRDGGQIESGSLLGFEPLDTARGAGGTLDINAAESIEITGTGDINGEAVNSSIFTLAESNGDAGDLTLTTDKLTVSDGGEINTSASALGAAGNLTIRANNLDLNRGTLKAETAAGTGGNITLDIDNTITLSSESLISAAATGDANGGNIDIDTTFIIASPQSNSDILANAQQGTGGRITIDAESIFGLQVRPESDSTNDIDASGGVDGQVIINTPDVDVTKGLVEVPQNVVEPEQSVAQACPNRASGTASGLIVKGKGGIPPEPTEPFIADPILVRGQTSARNPSTHYADIKPIKTSIGDILPARGVMVTESGEVILTAYPTPNTTARNLKASFNCG